jgi:hypothetical protein
VSGQIGPAECGHTEHLWGVHDIKPTLHVELCQAIVS